MTDYIERGALIAFVRGVRKRLPKDSKDFFTRCEMLKLILNFQQYVELQPAADVEPVVRGEWMWYTRKEAEVYAPFGMVVCAESYVCSNCGKYIGRSSPRDSRPKYCENCGARMDHIGYANKTMDENERSRT